MFGLFKKKPALISSADHVWMSEAAKWKACAALAATEPAVYFIAWFDASFDKWQQYCSTHNIPFPPTSMAREITAQQLQNKRPVFIEHYPFLYTEQQLFEKLRLTEATVYCSMDEAVFKLAGGDRTIDLMKKLGMAEDEMISHRMITASIRKAQEKIQKRTGIEQTARSQEEWLTRNHIVS